ncbi:MAG: hypothetical protein RIA09_09905 [Hoeflea sp.]|uniref:hypothetical protein n=1 Tax=Hoeflea sp. TaxID=1940281 RepID=UPI0032ED0DF6
MSGKRSHWDPISGTIEVETPDTSTIRQGIAIPPVVNRILLGAALLSIFWVMVEGFVTDAFPFVPVAATTVVWGLFFGAAQLENEDGRKIIRRVRLAKGKGWSYTGELMARVREFAGVSKSDGVDRETRLVKSERALAVEARVPELTITRVGAFAGALFDGEFWGESSQDGLPFWLAIGAMNMESGLAFNSDLRRDAFGGKGGYGQFFSLLGAYRIDRKTGIRTVVMPENLFSKGPLDRDLKTESIEFNRAFRISSRYKGEARAAADLTLDTLRVLTPATQDVMLAMHKRYHNTGFVLDDDILFFMAQDKLVGANAAPDRIDALIVEIAEDFERAKFSLKRYVE